MHCVELKKNNEKNNQVWLYYSSVDRLWFCSSTMSVGDVCTHLGCGESNPGLMRNSELDGIESHGCYRYTTPELIEGAASYFLLYALWKSGIVGGG